MSRDRKQNTNPKAQLAAGGAVALVAVLLFLNGRSEEPERPRTTVDSSSQDRTYALARVPADRGDRPLEDLGPPDDGSEVLVVSSDQTVFFWYGAHVDSPYRISRRGLEILVNGHVIERVEWPGRFFVAEDPPPPVPLTEKTKLNELHMDGPHSIEWLSLKTRWFFSHYHPKEATKRFIAFCRQLPCAKSVSVREEPGTDMKNIDVLLYSGDIHTTLVSETHDRRPGPRSDAVKRAEERMLYLKGELADGGFVLLRSGYEFGFPRTNHSWWDLPELVEALKSDADADTKAKRFQDLLFGDDFSVADIRLKMGPLLTDFRGSPQLDARMDAIRRERRNRTDL